MRSKNRIERKGLSNRLAFQSDLLFKIRKYFNSADLKEIATPILGFPTKEYGDGEFLAISKLLPGKFYSLPPSPQLYKQYLMAAFPKFKGYYQIAYNFRPEIGDAIHAQEFRQIDFEISQPSLYKIEKILKDLCALAFSTIKIKPKFITLKFDDALRLYGSDSPDLRYRGGEIQQSGKEAWFEIPLKDVVDNKKVNTLVKEEKNIHYKKTRKGHTFRTRVEQFELLGSLRNKLIQQNVVSRQSPWSFILIVDLPLFKRNPQGQISTFHHPQMSPMTPIKFWKAANTGNISKLLEIKANGCELIVNGMEVAGGNVRNSDKKIQSKILDLIGATESQIDTTYRPLLDLFSQFPKYKSAGAAMGFERLIFLLTQTTTLSENQPFPLDIKSNEFFGGPFLLSGRELQQLGIDYEHPMVTFSRKSAIHIVEGNNNFIHDRNHILDVEQNVVSIARQENILPGDLFILRLAAHWHDVGRQDLLQREIIPHPEASIRLFKSWAKKANLSNIIINRVTALIRDHDNHTKNTKNDKLFDILQDGDKLDILNAARIHRILGYYGQGLQAGQYNYFQSAIFWNAMRKQLKNMLHTEAGIVIFKERFLEFQRLTRPLYAKMVRNTKKLIALGGAETISGAFKDLDNALLASITVNRIKFVYVPIGIFNNPKLVKTASEYAEKIKKYYQSFGYNIDFDYVKITDKEFDIVSKLKKSHIIYLSGGDTKFLAAKLKSRLILQALRGAYTRNAVIIGNSAGILSLLENAVSFSYGSTPVAINGIGLLKDYSILVHFSDEKKKAIKNIEKRVGHANIVTLTESEAAIFINGKFIAKI